jgi:teichuronic acid biosynthesis glycosyltransferase TuaC
MAHSNPTRAGFPEGLRVLLATNRFPSPAAPFSGTFVPPFRRALEALGAEVEWVIVQRHERGPLVYLEAPRALQESARRFQPDVVHVLWGGALALITVKAIRRIPVVVTFGGGDLDGSYIARSESIVEHLSRFLAAASSRYAARRASHIVLVSRTLRRELPVKLSAPCSIAPAALDPKLFAPMEQASCRRRLGWEPQLKHVLFLSSSLRPEKRFELAERATSILKARGYELRLHELRSVPHAEVPIWMNAADVALLTSRSEGSSRALREALACGRPTVSVAVGDAGEWLTALEGCRIARDDPRSIADSIEAIWDFGHLPDARARACAYTWSSMARAMDGIYRECVRRFRARAHHAKSSSSSGRAVSRAFSR